MFFPHIFQDFPFSLMMWSTDLLEPASRDPTSKFWQYNLKLSLKDCIFWTTGRILKLQKSKKLRILPAFEWNYLQSCTGKGNENRRQKSLLDILSLLILQEPGWASFWCSLTTSSIGAFTFSATSVSSGDSSSNSASSEVSTTIL